MDTISQCRKCIIYNMHMHMHRKYIKKYKYATHTVYFYYILIINRIIVLHIVHLITTSLKFFIIFI